MPANRLIRGFTISDHLMNLQAGSFQLVNSHPFTSTHYGRILTHDGNGRLALWPMAFGLGSGYL